MSIDRWRSASAFLAFLLVAGIACDGDEDLTGPSVDREAPSVVITEAPDASPAGQEVAIAFTASDGVALESVECGWGTPGTPPDVSQAGGLEPDRAASFADGATRNASFPALSWDAFYEAVVVAENGSGRAESASVSFDTPMPAPPVLTSFSTPAWTEPLWYGMGGLPEGDSFESRIDNGARTEMFCAADYPIVDGTTCEAQVFAVRGSAEIGSQIRETTADFDPEYSATGSWSGVCGAPGPFSCDMTLELVDTDGAVTGAWTRTCASGSEGDLLTGTRTDWSLDLKLQELGEYDDFFSGVFFTLDRIEAFSGIADVFWQCTVDRQ